MTIGTISTVGTLLGTVVVSGVVMPTIGTGISTTQPAAGFTAIGVWLATSQSINVAVMPGLFTTTQVTTGTAQAVWIMNPTTVTVTIAGTTTGTVSISGVALVTGPVATTGLPVWIQNQDVGRTNVVIIVTSTGAGAFATTMAITVYIDTSQITAGAANWVIPANKSFRIKAINMMVSNSSVTTPVQVRGFVIASTATPTWTSAVPIQAGIMAVAPAATAPAFANANPEAGIDSGKTIAVAATAQTNAFIGIIMVQGYLFP